MGDRTLIPLVKTLNLHDEAASVPSAYLFDTPLGGLLTGLLKVIHTDNVLDLDEVTIWNELQRKGKALDEAKCDALLKLQCEDESDDDYDDIAELRELLRQKEERSKDLSQQIADAQALENQLHDVEPMSHHSVNGNCESALYCSDLDTAACPYKRSRIAAREMEEISEAVAFEPSNYSRYLTSEDEFRSSLTSFSKHLLATPTSLLDSAFKSRSRPSSLSRDSDVLEELQVRYQDASKALARGKMEFKYQEIMSALHTDVGPRNNGPKSNDDPNEDTLRGTFSLVLDAASKAFVFCKDSTDLDLQLGRMRFCNEAKNRIMEHLVDQFSRQIISEYLISADFLFHCNLGAFLGEMKNSISLLTSTKSSKQRSLDVVFSFANAPPVISQSDLARGLSALMRLTIGEIPNLISEDEQRDSWASMSIEEVILVLSDEWELRQTKNEAAERAWANDLEICGASLLKIDDKLKVKSRALLDLRFTTELSRLKDQSQMAKESIRQAVQLSDKAPPKSGSLPYLLAKAPVYFHTNPEKFDKLVRMVKDS